MRVHVIQAGRLVGNEVVMRAARRSAVFRGFFSYRPFEFPVYSYVLEHDEGHILIDTGLTHRVRVPRLLRRVLPNPIASVTDEVGPQMRSAGLRTEDVRLVVATHLDWDHVGGIGHFPNAEIIVHRPEYEFASTFFGKQRYQPKLWPDWFKPSLYDLDPEPYGPFPRSRSITDDAKIHLVPIPGHSIAQVGVVVRTDGPALFFGADHMLRQDWFADDVAAGRLMMLGFFYPKLAEETSRRIARFVEDVPTILLPAHDAQATSNVAAGEPLRL